MKDLNFPALLTYQFIHAGRTHLVWNVAFLLVFGSALEPLLGRTRFALFYLGSGAAAGLFALTAGTALGLDTDNMFIGASGSISGVMGGCLAAVFFWRWEGAARLRAGGTWTFKLKYLPLPALGWFLYTDLDRVLVSAQRGYVNSSWVHLGGWLFGAAVVLVTREAVGWELGRLRLVGLKLARLRFAPYVTADDLRAIIKDRPDEARALVDLARWETRAGDKTEGERLYRKGIFYLWRQGKKDRAARVFAEFFARHRKIYAGPFQMELCELLLAEHEYEAAAGAMERIVAWSHRDPDCFPVPTLKRAYQVLPGLLSDKLHRPTSARYYEKEYAAAFAAA